VSSNGVGVVLALTAGLGLAALPPAAAGGPALSDNPLEGRLLFESKGCHQCHGLAGSGEAIGPNLGEGRFSGSFLDLGAALWDHVPGMRVAFEAAGMEWPTLTPDEAGRLIGFLYFIDYLGRPGDARAGEEVFAARGCAACHTLGEGRRKVGPDLSELRRFASPLFIAQSIWNHGPSMLESMRALDVRPPTFEQGDLADLSAFIRQRARPGPQERVLLAPGNPNVGRELFRTQGCAACHGEGGHGGTGGPDLTRVGLQRSAEGIAGTMWNHALAMSEVMAQRGIGWPEFTTSELADVVAFLYFLPFADPPGDPARGERVFTTRSCAGCHGGGSAAREGPDLAGTDAASSPEALVAAMWSHAPVMSEAILAEGRPWPLLTGEDLRDLLAFLGKQAKEEPATPTGGR
jgi:mono/diheme cytochrome c family protein